MEDILARELELQHKLQKLEIRHQKLRKENRNVDLRQISTPEEIGAIAESRREKSMSRNAELLRDLEMAAGKLHTMNLCPLESKLNELKEKFGKEGSRSSGSECRSQQEQTTESDPDLV